MGAEKIISAEPVVLNGEKLQSVVQAANRSPPGDNSSTQFGELMSTSSNILDVLCRYRMNSREPGSRADEGCLKILAVIYSHVKVRQPILNLS